MAVEGIPAADETRWLVVRAGGTRYGIPSSIVRQVVRGLVCHPVPGSQPRLVGLAQLSGEPLAVIDLCAAVEGGPPESGRGVLVVVAAADAGSVATLAVAVDAAERVISLDVAPELVREGPVGGVLDVDGEAVQLLRPDAVVTGEWSGRTER